MTNESIKYSKKDKIQNMMNSTIKKVNKDVNDKISNKNMMTLNGKSKIQTVMNNTRDKLNKGKFKERDFHINYQVVRCKKISEEFDNYRIVHITDIHIGQWITPERLNGIVNIINSLNPDMIALTGDYVSYQAEGYLDILESAFKKLKPKDATFSVLGNHDHLTNPDEIKQVLENSGIINLENDVYFIRRNDALLQIAGVDSITLNKDDINEVLKKLQKNIPAIMLAHEPDFADTTCEIDEFILQLSGHSHGGQITIPKIGTPIRGPNFTKYPAGRYHVKNMVQYTNSGVGTNAFWFRINCPPEITVFELKRRK